MEVQTNLFPHTRETYLLSQSNVKQLCCPSRAERLGHEAVTGRGALSSAREEAFPHAFDESSLRGAGRLIERFRRFRGTERRKPDPCPELSKARFVHALRRTEDRDPERRSPVPPETIKALALDDIE